MLIHYVYCVLDSHTGFCSCGFLRESTCYTLSSSAANQGDNTVSVAQGGTATPGATKQLLPPDRVFKRNIYLYIHQINQKQTLHWTFVHLHFSAVCDLKNHITSIVCWILTLVSAVVGFYWIKLSLVYINIWSMVNKLISETINTVVSSILIEYPTPCVKDIR